MSSPSVRNAYRKRVEPTLVATSADYELCDGSRLRVILVMIVRSGSSSPGSGIGGTCEAANCPQWRSLGALCSRAVRRLGRALVEKRLRSGGEPHVHRPTCALYGQGGPRSAPKRAAIATMAASSDAASGSLCMGCPFESVLVDSPGARANRDYFCHKVESTNVSKLFVRNCVSCAVACERASLR